MVLSFWNASTVFWGIFFSSSRCKKQVDNNQKLVKALLLPELGKVQHKATAPAPPHANNRQDGLLECFWYFMHNVDMFFRNSLLLFVLNCLSSSASRLPSKTRRTWIWIHFNWIIFILLVKTETPLITGKAFKHNPFVSVSNSSVFIYPLVAFSNSIGLDSV